MWGKRLKEIREKHLLTQAELANILKKDTTVISRYERGKGAKALPYYIEVGLKGIFSDKEIEYIKFGSNIKDKDILVKEPSVTYSNNSKNNLIYIPFLEDVYASAGGGSCATDGTKRGLMAFDRAFLQDFLGLWSVNNIEIIRAGGNSMEPTIKSGELLFVQRWDGSFVDNGIYVIICGSALLVKRVSFDPATKEYILKSDNSEVETYKVKVGEGEDCRFVGRVVAHLESLG